MNNQVSDTGSGELLVSRWGIW